MGTVVICGPHAVRHALKSSAGAVLELWVQNNKHTSSAITELVKQAEREHIACQCVALRTLDKITHGARHQGIAARYQQAVHAQDLDALLQADDISALFLVLDGVQDPHNLGACLRTADAVGVRAVIIPKNRAAGLNETVSKIACGGAEHTPLIVVTNLCRSLRTLRDAGVWIVGTDHHATRTLYQEDLNGAVALVMGSEGRGLRKNVREHCDTLVGLPMVGVVESLNVSVAAGVCLYEIFRQRSHAS